MRISSAEQVALWASLVQRCRDVGIAPGVVGESRPHVAPCALARAEAPGCTELAVLGGVESVRGSASLDEGVPSSAMKLLLRGLRVVDPLQQSPHAVRHHKRVQARGIQSTHAPQLLDVLREEPVQHARQRRPGLGVVRDVEAGSVLRAEEGVRSPCRMTVRGRPPVRPQRHLNKGRHRRVQAGDVGQCASPVAREVDHPRVPVVALGEVGRELDRVRCGKDRANPDRRPLRLRRVVLAEHQNRHCLLKQVDHRLPDAVRIGPEDRCGWGAGVWVVLRRLAQGVGDDRAYGAHAFTPACRRASRRSSNVGWRSLRRSEPSAFVPRSFFQWTLTLERRTPAVTNGRMLRRTPSSRSGFQPIGCSWSLLPPNVRRRTAAHRRGSA